MVEVLPGDTFNIHSEPPPSPKSETPASSMESKPTPYIARLREENKREQAEKKEDRGALTPEDRAFNERMNPKKEQEAPKQKSRWEGIKEKVGGLYQKAKGKPKEAPKGKTDELDKWRQQRKEKVEKEMKAERQEKIDRAKMRLSETMKGIQEKAKVVQAKAREHGKKAGEYVKGTQIYAGFQVGAQETQERTKEKLYWAGREVGRLPITVSKKGYGFAKGRYESMRESIKLNPQSRGWHSGLLWHPGSARYAPGGGMAARIRSGGEGRFAPRTGAAAGRQPRSAIPKGIIRPYWSKKLKKMARTNIHRFGVEQGMAKTRQVAAMLGWKMQESK